MTPIETAIVAIVGLIVVPFTAAWLIHIPLSRWQDRFHRKQLADQDAHLTKMRKEAQSWRLDK